MDEERWIRGDLLGKGGFARVYSMQNMKTGEFYAGKFSGITLPSQKAKLEGSAILKKAKKARDMLKDEIDIHKNLLHPSILRYISSFATNACYEEKEIVVSHDEKGECEVLVLEICPNKSLADLLKARGKISEDEAKFYMFHLANALKYLRLKGIIHRDIKLGNILLDADMFPKLADFGLAIYDIYRRRKTTAGTPNYIAPETLTTNSYSYPVDTWALGVCLYALVSGKPPFETDDVRKTYRKIMDEDYDMPEYFSPNLQDLISNIFLVNPEDRIQIEEVIEHPFFTSTQIIEKLPVEARIEEPSWENVILSPASKEKEENTMTSKRRKELEDFKALWTKAGYLPVDKFYLHVASFNQDVKPEPYGIFVRRFNDMRAFL